MQNRGSSWPFHKPSLKDSSGLARYRLNSGALLMRTFLVEITAKLFVRTDTDPDELPADIYSHIAEFIPRDEDIVDLEVQAFLLPGQDDGSSH